MDKKQIIEQNEKNYYSIINSRLVLDGIDFNYAEWKKAINKLGIKAIFEYDTNPIKLELGSNGYRKIRIITKNEFDAEKCYKCIICNKVVSVVNFYHHYNSNREGIIEIVPICKWHDFTSFFGIIFYNLFNDVFRRNLDIKDYFDRYKNKTKI